MAVNHSHIVPATYLRRWVDNEGMLEMILANSGASKSIPVKHAGVRAGGFYKRERPQGERSDDIETVSLQDIEDKAGRILHTLEDRWPLDGDDKLALAMLVALQLVRGPKWFEWHDEFTSSTLAEYRSEGRFVPNPDSGATEEQTFTATLEHLLSSTPRLVTMLRLTAKIASCFGSMTWSLLRFNSRTIATSDHPVVVWPATAAGRTVAPAIASTIGVGNVFEVRFPAGPSSAILMTWRDRPDPIVPVLGKSHHADNLNAFTIVEAEKQWFHAGGSKRPRTRSARWMPLSLELVPGYSLREAAYCQRRRSVVESLNERLGEEIEHSLRAEITHISDPRQDVLAAAKHPA